MTKNKKFQSIEWISFGIFPGYLMFVHDFKHSDIIKELDKLKAEDWKSGIEYEEDFVDNGCWKAMYREVINTKGISKKLFYLIIPEQFDFSDYDYARLAHEILHICQFYLPDVLDRNKEHEAEAYLHTHLMTKCLEVLRK